MAASAIERNQTVPRTGVQETPAVFGEQPDILRRDEFDRDVWCVLGLPIDIATVDTAVAAIDRAVASGKRLSFVTPNVNWLARASWDSQARAEILAADLSFADGAPLALAARRLGVPLASRVAGSDIFETMRRRPGFAGRRIRVFFFGGRDGAAEAAAKALEAEDGALEAAGWLNPGYGDVDAMSAPEVIDAVNAAEPDFIVVALGAAKGQAWIERNKERLDAPVISHLGAVVDFTAGGVRRAPAWMRACGLEWAWRIKEEPSLWRRYARDGAALAGLGVSRLAPTLSALRRLKSTGPARTEIRQSADAVRVILTGDHVHGDLAEARKAFRTASAAGKKVILDCSDLGRVDMAFLGLVLILEKSLLANGLTFCYANAGEKHKTLFAANGVWRSSPAAQPAENATASALTATG